MGMKLFYQTSPQVTLVRTVFVLASAQLAKVIVMIVAIAIAFYSVLRQ
jgi:hypothetical protein